MLCTPSPGGKGGTALASERLPPEEQSQQGTQTHTHSRFSLFVIVMFYIVTTNTELANTEPLLLGEIQGMFLLASGYNIFINRSR